MLEASSTRPRQGQREEVSEKVWRGLDQVSVDLVEAKGIHDRGQEVFERLCNDQEEVDSCEHPCERVPDGLGNAAPVATLIVFADTAGRHIGTILSHCALFSSEEIGASVGRPVGKEPETRDRNEYTDNTLDEEEPLPSV